MAAVPEPSTPVTLRIVHVVARAFLPAEDGGRLKTACLATALARRGDLHWVSLDNTDRFRSQAAPVTTLTLPFGGSGTWHGTGHVSAKQRGPRSLMGWLRAARAGVRLPWRWLPRTSRHGEVFAQIARLKPDLLVVDETVLAPFAAFAPAGLRIIVTQNHDSALLAETVFAGADPAHQLRAAKRLEDMERSLFPRMDQVWGVQQGDLDSYRSYGVESQRLVLAPNVVPDECFEPGPRPGIPGRALFFGSLWYPPNRQALEWLLESWPLVRKRLPDATLVVAGRGAGPELEAWAARTEGVELLGFVPDLRPLFQDCALVVVPLWKGGGTKVKTIEAMAAGKPILSTPVGAEGLAMEDGVHAVIRETGEAFIEALAIMVQAPESWQAMALRAQDHTRAHFSLASLQAAVDQALDALIESAKHQV